MRKSANSPFDFENFVSTVEMTCTRERVYILHAQNVLRLIANLGGTLVYMEGFDVTGSRMWLVISYEILFAPLQENYKCFAIVRHAWKTTVVFKAWILS